MFHGAERTEKFAISAFYATVLVYDKGHSCASSSLMF